MKGVISDATKANILHKNDGSDYTGMSQQNNHVLSVRSQQFRNERQFGNKTLGNLAVSNDGIHQMARLGGAGSEVMQ